MATIPASARRGKPGSRVRPFRTILHGTCLVNGKHPPGSQLARECPVLRRQKRRVIQGQGVDSGASESASSEPLADAGLESGLRDAEDEPDAPLAHLRRKSGRPASSEPSRHSRYRRRHPEYRQREHERLTRRRQPPA